VAVARSVGGHPCVATAWFAHHDVTVERVLTDNAKVYRIGSSWAAACAEPASSAGSPAHTARGRTGRPSGFNRTLLDEFAHAQAWLSDTDRLAALDNWVHAYNTRPAHSAIGGHPPITRLAS
jgi:transposase InsO family protein